VAEQPYTPQNRTDGEEQPEGAPEQTPQGRTEQESERAEEGRPGGDA
jgi:hypothetical protein